MSIRVSVNNQQSLFAIDEAQIVTAVRQVLSGNGISLAEVSVAVVTDPEIHVLNRDHLNHDYPTDVLSFLYEHRTDSQDCFLDGELIVSTDTARRVGREHDMPEHDELLLYIVHGSLHLVGFDDHSAADRAKMRAAEREQLSDLGIKLPKPKTFNGENPIDGTESLS